MAFKAPLAAKTGGEVSTTLVEFDETEPMPGEVTAAIDYSTVNYKDAMTVSGNLPNALLPVNDSNERPIHFVTGH